MSKSVSLSAFMVSVLLVSLASAKLPETEAVQKAYAAAGEVLEEAPEVTAKAYFAIILAAKPTAANRAELVESVADTLRNDFTELGIAHDIEEACFFHFWQEVAAHFPQAVEYKTMVLDLASKQLPWAQAQARLLARGDAYALGLGLDRLVKSPEPSSATVPFVTAVAAHMARATPEDLNKFLWFGDKEGFSEIVAAVQKRFLADKDLEIQKLAATPPVRRILLRKAVREIADQYDLKTLVPPALEPWTMQGPGEIRGAFEKLKQLVEGNPKVKPEHPQFAERMKAFDALIAAYPNYGRIYEYKADYLFYAGLQEEALLTQTAVVRMHPNSANSGYYSAQARYWMALGFRGQALVEVHRALGKSISGYDGNTLLIFCEVAVAESLKDDGLVPAVWDAVIAERLGKLEDQQAALMGNAKTLYVDAIRFWDKRGDFPRARAALARLKQKGGSALIAAHQGSFAAWEKRWDEGALAFFYGLPEAPKPYGVDLELAFHEGNLPGAWTLYSKWAATEPKAVAPRLYGAAAFLDLGAPYLALALIEEAGTLKPTVQEAQLLARVKAGSAARLGEPVAAALAYAKSGDVESLSTYWLQVFIEANQAAVYSRISNRALEVLSAGQRDAVLLPWAWQTYAMTAPASAVDTWRDTLTADGGLPKAPLALAAGLTQGAVAAQRRLQVAWSDAQVVQGEVARGDWFWFAQLAATDGREADAAFYAACWLLGLSPNQDVDTAKEAQARSWVNVYRTGKVAEGNFAEALLRDPCNAEVMVQAYESARASGDLFKAADYLRQIWMADGEDRIDLLAACNVATAAADWELLLTVSQTALAKQPSDESRGWYNLALVACRKLDTAKTIRSQMYDGTLRTVARELEGWVPFVDRRLYLDNLSDGEYAELHGAIKDVQALREARKNAEKEAEANRYYKNKVIELAAAVSKRLQGASPSIRAHVAFQLGEIDEAAYKAKLSTSDDRAFAQIFSILYRWNDGGQVKLAGDDLADVQAIMYDQAQHLRFRVMAYTMLLTAEIAPAPRPLRASDPLLLERATVGALAEMRAGRLTLVNGAEELLGFLGGWSSIAFPNNKSVRTISLPTPPAVMRLRITPDLPEQRLSGLTSANYEQHIVEFGKAGLYPVLERALTTLQLDLAAAGADAEARWAAINQGGLRVWRLGESFYLEDGTHAEASMAVIQPHLGKYPVDAFAVLTSRLLPLASIEEYIPRLPANAQAVIKVGRQASRNAANENERKTGVRYSPGFDSNKDVENVILSFPPGSEMFSFVSEALARNVPPAQIKATVADEKNRRIAAATAAKLRAENLKLFDAALAKGDMPGVEKAALVLGGAHYVKWALRSTTASLAQLVQARSYATNWPDTYALTAEIQRRQNELSKPQAQTQSYRPSRYSGSSGTSWSSFSASMSAKSSASVQYQKERDAKNFVIRTRSDGSYSTHRKY